jgi:hypothetical protein
MLMTTISRFDAAQSERSSSGLKSLTTTFRSDMAGHKRPATTAPKAKRRRIPKAPYVLSPCNGTRMNFVTP